MNELTISEKAESAIIEGDLKTLSPGERVAYYNRVCDAIGLLPTTRPFGYIVLNGKLTLYALRGCTDQLRKLHQVSIRIDSITAADGVITAQVSGTDKTGRTDTEIGVVPIGKARIMRPGRDVTLVSYAKTVGACLEAAETLATRSDQLAKYANGLPRTDADATRRLLIRHLAQAIPAKEAGAEVSLALAGVAADSLSQMIPGLLGGGQAQGLLNGQRERLMTQIEQDLDNTLLHVYRELSDPELEQFVEFAQSEAGKAYYQAALQALRAGLAVGMSSNELEPAPQGI